MTNKELITENFGVMLFGESVMKERLTPSAYESVRVAKEKGIPYQREILTYGGTDASSMQLAGSGSLCGALSIPTRYIHSGVETCDLSDAEACSALAVEFIKSLS